MSEPQCAQGIATVRLPSMKNTQPEYSDTLRARPAPRPPQQKTSDVVSASAQSATRYSPL
jgi:hypothetical protein